MTQLLQMYHGTLRLSLHNADRVDLVSALAYVVSQLAPAQVPRCMPPPPCMPPFMLSFMKAIILTLTLTP